MTENDGLENGEDKKYKSTINNNYKLSKVVK